MIKRYVKGFHYTNEGADYKSYEIDDLKEDHAGKILVFKDIKLRDKIINMLNKEELERNKNERNNSDQNL